MRKQDLSKMFFRKSKSPFIGKDEWFDNLSEREIKKLFEDIDVPDYNTVEIIGVQILETDSINFKMPMGRLLIKQEVLEPIKKMFVCSLIASNIMDGT